MPPEMPRLMPGVIVAAQEEDALLTEAGVARIGQKTPRSIINRERDLVRQQQDL